MSVLHDITIIGAGAVGLSVAYALQNAAPHLDIAVVEKENAESKHQTGHNSGVIHSGIYYQPGSLKAKNCIEGYRMLLDFAQEHGIDHEICGKLIVATESWELPLLDRIYERGVQNGLDGLSVIGPEAALEVEPHIRVLKAIRVPQSGIIHYADVAAALRKKLEENGARFYFSSALKKVIHEKDRSILFAGNNEIHTRFLVNCAGLYSDKIALMSGLDPQCRIIPFRGEYYVLKPEKQHLVNHLVYPVPNPNFPFLGVHFTRMIRGGIEAGPNAVLAFKREGYSKWDLSPGELTEILTFPGFQKLAAKYWRTGLDELHRSYNKSAFANALKKLLPEIKKEDLSPGGAGVRAQALRRDGSIVDDYLIREAPGMVHVINAPSPAATSSLSIGKTVAGMVLSRINENV